MLGFVGDVLKMTFLANGFAAYPGEQGATDESENRVREMHSSFAGCVPAVPPQIRGSRVSTFALNSESTSRSGWPRKACAIISERRGSSSDLELA